MKESGERTQNTYKKRINELKTQQKGNCIDEVKKIFKRTH